ncbi:hypothetical protein EDD22DRAFT_954727 [Suillus occidentalis]|nr:hypothetical protein EDD22DRAFT_954727 [Suillus occidentalis]
MSYEPSTISETSSHVEDLLKDLNLGVKSGRKRKICHGPIQLYLHAARWFPLGIDPFTSLEDVLYEGIEAEFSESREDTPDQPKEASNNRHKELCITHYKELTKLLPTLSELISRFEKFPSAMDNFIHALSSAANDARSDDTGSLTREGLVYMLKNPETDQFNPPLLKQHGKIARGWNHVQTARLLCPMRMLDVFDNDPLHRSFMNKVKEGEITITAAKLPLFLYDESMLDSTRKSQGCLRGYYLKRVFRHIFTGPSSAISANTHKGTKTPKGRIHGMTSPLPRAIAYAAVQAYFQLSSATQWCQQIEDLDLVLFYDRVVEMLEGNTNKQWVDETLNHWKLETPGLVQRGRSRARAELYAFDSEDDMDGFFDSSERSPNSRGQGSQGTNDGNDNTHGIPFFHIQIVHSANIHPVPAVQGNNATDPTSGTVAQPTRTSRQKKRRR